jgi:hypothetical protein
MATTPAEARTIASLFGHGFAHASSMIGHIVASLSGYGAALASPTTQCFHVVLYRQCPSTTKG